MCIQQQMISINNTSVSTIRAIQTNFSQHLNVFWIISIRRDSTAHSYSFHYFIRLNLIEFRLAHSNQIHQAHWNVISTKNRNNRLNSLPIQLENTIEILFLIMMTGEESPPSSLPLSPTPFLSLVPSLSPSLVFPFSLSIARKSTDFPYNPSGQCPFDNDNTAFQAY